MVCSKPELGCSHKKSPKWSHLRDYVPPVKAEVGVPGRLGGLMMSRLRQSHGSPVTSGDAHICAAAPSSGSTLQWGGGEGWTRVCEGSPGPRSCPLPRPCRVAQQLRKSGSVPRTNVGGLSARKEWIWQTAGYLTQ